MNRRAAIMAALAIGARVSMGQVFQGITADKTAEITVLDFTVKTDSNITTPVNAFKMHYKNRTATVSMDEVMDALGATVDPPKFQK